MNSYEVERRQVGDRNVGASRYASTGRRAWRSMYRPGIRDPNPAGAAIRRDLARVADVEQRKTNEMIGAELGYRYVDSPVIADVPGGPEHLFRQYIPTTWPGARLPHVWLNDGTAMQDKLGDGYTLLKLGSAVRGDTNTDSLERPLRDRGAPLETVSIADEVAREVYGYDLLLVRPDMHVVWRGNQLPEEPLALADIAIGNSVP